MKVDQIDKCCRPDCLGHRWHLRGNVDKVDIDNNDDVEKVDNFDDNDSIDNTDEFNQCSIMNAMESM